MLKVPLQPRGGLGGREVHAPGLLLQRARHGRLGEDVQVEGELPLPRRGHRVLFRGRHSHRLRRQWRRPGGRQLLARPGWQHDHAADDASELGRGHRRAAALPAEGGHGLPGRDFRQRDHHLHPECAQGVHKQIKTNKQQHTKHTMTHKHINTNITNNKT